MLFQAIGMLAAATLAATSAAALPSERGLLPITQYPGANLLAKTYPNDITARYNNSVWFLPAPKAAVQALLPAGQKLLASHPVPGLAADEWPLVLQSGLDLEVKQFGLSVGDFYTSRLTVPWMDKSGDGVTPFSFHYYDLLSVSVLPIIGVVANGLYADVGKYNPDYLLFRDLGSGFYGQDTQKVGGEPLFSIRARDASTAERRYTLDLFKDFTNQGYAYNTDKCIFHPTTYDLPLTKPTFIKGDVTLGKDVVPAALAKTYTNVQGLHAAEHFVELLNQPCVGRAKFPSRS